MEDDDDDSMWQCLSAIPGEPRDDACWAVDVTVAVCVVVSLVAFATTILQLCRWGKRCHPAEYPIRAVQVSIKKKK